MEIKSSTLEPELFGGRIPKKQRRWNEVEHGEKNVDIYLISGKFIFQLNDKAFLVD